MSRHEDEQSIRNEPHLRPDARPVDPSEARADRVLRREGERGETTYQDGQSIYDEPDVLPGRPGEVVEQNWSCSKCGYNLRGLPTHHRCPECGHRELYRPAPRGSASYQEWLRRRVMATSPARAWATVVLAALCSGVGGLLAAMFGTDPGILVAPPSMILLAVVFGPTVEETMKIAAAACVVEVRPYLFRQVEQVQVATVGAALLFAALENVIYLYVYIPNHSVEFALWRWTVCVAMHVGCTLVASRGLVSVWQQAITELRPPRIARGLRWLVIAIVLHASYNAAVVAYELLR